MENNLNNRFKELSDLLVEQINVEGFWTGELSSSALGVAVSIAALHFDDPNKNRKEIVSGLDWLKNNINSDGSFGDTPESPGNISTSLLVYAALNLYSSENNSLKNLQNTLADYLQKESIDVNSTQISKAILAHYKKDYTFSVPILTMCALCGIPAKNGFEHIPQLPFELSLLPQKFYRSLNLSVVSYAIPALIAVGIVIFKKKKPGLLGKWIREWSVTKALRILQKSLPESGGFLEAIPLTAFVTLSLINAGFKEMDVVKKGIVFLKRTQRNDGGWPIDVDLSTWVTTLSIKALRSKKDEVLSATQQNVLVEHLKSIQNKEIHPFNGTRPGGWGWTNFSGSVPDCDDTPGTILALLQLKSSEEIKSEVIAGAKWLLQLQNNDGGFPTFSKGWGKLPFDQSCADLTGHCILAISATLKNYRDEITVSELNSFEKATKKAAGYLQKHQRENGSWLPLWFGNQHTKNHENPVYGTARVLTYLQDAIVIDPSNHVLQNTLQPMINTAIQFLIHVQNIDGSWGGDYKIIGTIEETSLAISALIGTKHKIVCQKGFQWLDQYFIKNGLKPAPIGLYFASLWYDEKMYPLTAYLEAVSRSIEVQQ
ncbi:MAG: squalene--hopene cyclase [Bacteroidetes bacterium]|nr:squalene--hopene cyclase [Bacteroidota bacterium]